MCGSCDPDTLLAEVDALEDLLEPLCEASGTSSFETERMRVIQGRMRRKMSGAVRSFQGGKIDAPTLERRFSSAINGAYPDAYQIGVGQWPRAQVTGADRDFLRRASASEVGFASGFVKDISGGKLSEKQIDARLDQYVLGAESVKTSGWTRKSPPETSFRWDLGLAAHCSDCLLLSSSSPFKRDELPTVPRAGDTQCRSRCQCTLVAVAEGGPRRQVQVNTIDPEATSGVKRVGNREPTKQERARVDDMRARINYHRRRIETAPTDAARRAAIVARRQANSELITYQQQRGISDVPMLDVGDVISGTQITADVAEGLAVRGIDGTTILLADAEEWSATTASLLERIEELLNEGG